ncbi:MAG: chemotaxis protein, partial [Gallionella sp.]|nr:chemotaxis protein [Gallionella sp.]
MFCGKLRQEYQAALDRLARFEQENAELRAALSLAADEREKLQAERQADQLAIEVTRQIYSNMQGFGVSFIALQGSQA